MSETYEVTVVTDGDQVVEVLKGISLLMSPGTAFESILASVGVLGLLVAMIYIVVQGNLRVLMTWLLAFVLVYSVMFVPKANVIVDDKSDPTVAGEVIDDVPLGLAFAAHITTTMGNWVAQQFETVLSPPDRFSYRESGLMWGTEFLDEFNQMNFISGTSRRNLESFIRSCVMPYVTHQNLGESFIQSSDLGAFITTNYAPNRHVVWHEVGSLAQSRLCSSAHADVLVLLPALVGKSQLELARKIYTDLDGTDTAQLVSRLDGDIQIAGVNFLGLSMSAADLAEQQMLVNLVQGTLMHDSSDPSVQALLNYTTSRAQYQSHLTMVSLGNLMQNAIPKLYILVLILLISIFPVIVAFGLIPHLGLMAVKNYLIGFVWLQAFPLLFVLINAVIVREQSEAGKAAADKLPDLPPGISVANAPDILALPSETAAMAGLFLTLIPVLSGIFTKGAMAMGGQLENILRPYQVSAEAAAGEAATGNISMGNLQLNNANYNNETANKKDHEGFYAGNDNQVFRSSSGIDKYQKGSGSVSYNVNRAMTDGPFNAAIAATSRQAVSDRLSATQQFLKETGSEYSEAKVHSVQDAQAIAQKYGTAANMERALGLDWNESTRKEVDDRFQLLNSLTDDDVQRYADDKGRSHEVGVQGSVGWGLSERTGAKVYNDNKATASISDGHYQTESRSTSKTDTTSQSHAISEALEYLDKTVQSQSASLSDDKTRSYTRSRSDEAALRNTVRAAEQDVDELSNMVESSTDVASSVNGDFSNAVYERYLSSNPNLSQDEMAERMVRPDGEQLREFATIAYQMKQEDLDASLLADDTATGQGYFGPLSASVPKNLDASLSQLEDIKDLAGGEMSQFSTAIGSAPRSGRELLDQVSRTETGGFIQGIQNGREDQILDRMTIRSQNGDVSAAYSLDTDVRQMQEDVEGNVLTPKSESIGNHTKVRSAHERQGGYGEPTEEESAPQVRARVKQQNEDRRQLDEQLSDLPNPLMGGF